MDRDGNYLGRNRFRRFNLHQQITGLNTIGAPSAMLMRVKALDGVGREVHEQWRDAYDHDLWIRVAKKFTVHGLNMCFSKFGLHADSGMTNDPLRSWRETRKIRSHHGGDRRLIDRLFWIPYVEARVKVFRLLKWKRMTGKAT